MASSTQKLIVEVVDARNLLPKDGHGSSSPYVVVDFYGQRRRTNTAVRDLNPTWNQVLEFNVGKVSNVFDDMLELDVYHDKKFGPTHRNNFLGRIRLSSRQFVKKGEEALIYYTLEKKSLISWIQGEIGLKIYYADQVIPPPPPPPVVEEAKAEEKTETPAAPPVVEEEAAAAAPLPEQQPSDAPAEKEPTVELAQPDPPAVEAEPPSNDGKLADDAALEVEKAPETEQLPTSPPPEAADETTEVDDDIVFEPTVREFLHQPVNNPMAMPPELAPDIKVVRINGPQPITRLTSSASNYSLDSQESIQIERSSFDLVDKMHYVFVHVVKARSLPTKGNPVVKIVIADKQVRSKPAHKAMYFEWDETFAFRHNSPESSTVLELSVWDPPTTDSTADLAGGVDFLGGICFDVTEIPLRDPPDSPLAPQWYRLEGGGAHKGDLMLATWVGTQADESFANAWKTDTTNTLYSRAKVYLSPKLWYLRATVLEAQDILPSTMLKEASFQIKVQLGFQVLKTKPSVTRNGAPSWNEDLVFVAAEPFSDHLVFSLECRQPKGSVALGMARIPLTTIERRVDDRKVTSRWFSFEHSRNDKVSYKGRLHLNLCFDGGYHVMDEAAHVCSDYRPTARQLWKPPIGTIELGIIGCKNLLPMKTIEGTGSTDAYAVVKYGTKWVRTRTVCDSFDPKWNEQYTWRVYDPCTVLTLGVFDDSLRVVEIDGSKEAKRPDFRIGKVRIRISTLDIGKVYRTTYPLTVLGNVGAKKMGDIEVAIRFVRTTPTLDFLHMYSQPSLPLMHHVKPLGVVSQEMLRSSTVKIVATHLSRSEPPLRREVVFYLLDSDSHTFSMRRVRANWLRIVNLLAGLTDIVRWVENTRAWKNPTSTILVHALLVMLVWFPDLIVPALSFYVFTIGAWNYRFRSKDSLPHFDPKLSLVDSVDRDELDEEFDTLPSSRPLELIRGRYDKLRMIGTRVQILLGDVASQGERVQALVTWRDPRATGIFIGLCFLVALLMYVVPSKMVTVASGFYYLRHPMFRDRLPSPALNFFRRLPALSDRII